MARVRIFFRNWPLKLAALALALLLWMLTRDDAERRRSTRERAEPRAIAPAADGPQQAGTTRGARP